MNTAGDLLHKRKKGHFPSREIKISLKKNDTKIKDSSHGTLFFSAASVSVSFLVFTCGRWPAGLLATLVVVVVVVVVVSVVGGDNFYTWAFPRAMYGLEKFKAESHFLSFVIF